MALVVPLHLSSPEGDEVLATCFRQEEAVDPHTDKTDRTRMIFGQFMILGTVLCI